MASQCTLYLQSLRNPGNAPMDKAAISIWPNPAEGLLTISNPDNAANGYAIKNFLGQTMMTAGLKAGQQSIDISHLIPGHYVINFHKNGEASGNEQFIKK